MIAKMPNLLLWLRFNFARRFLDVRVFLEVKSVSSMMNFYQLKIKFPDDNAIAQMFANLKVEDKQVQ